MHRMLEASINSGKAESQVQYNSQPPSNSSIYTEAPEAKFVMDRDQVAKCAQHCNAKRDAAKIAQEQSDHLHLCYLIDDLTKKYGPVVRDAKIVGVLDSAFDVVVVSRRLAFIGRYDCTYSSPTIFSSPNSALRSVFTLTRCPS